MRRTSAGRIAAKATAGAGAMIEEWTAWLMVRDRERDLARARRIKEAEQTRFRPPRPKVVRLPAKPTQSVHPPRGRRAA